MDQVSKSANDVSHGCGTTSSYRAGCRCHLCKQAKAKYRKHGAEPRTAREAYQHGTISRYTAKRCRCDLCRKANREYTRAYYAKNIKAADQLRTCETCGTFYITKLKMRQRFCNSACAIAETSDRSRTCAKCQSTYTARDVHYSVDPSLCPSCLKHTTSDGHQCPICEIPWWAPQNQHCCSHECQTLLDAKQHLVTANGGNHAG
jgi:hypothetical protein